MRTRSLLLGSLVLAACATAPAEEHEEATSDLAAAAPDATGLGPHAVTRGEYRLPAARNPDILDDRDTEIWAEVVRPQDLAPGARRPLLVFLHGNHSTCGRGQNPRIDDNVQYTMTGTCPDGYTVVPNHRGYDYLADRLASWGYVVVSINANRGITAAQGTAGDFGLNLARGRLVLSHLALLSRWNTEPGTTPAEVGADLAGTLDLGEVGLLGHSRGGEGVRAAYNLYADPGSPWPARIREPLHVGGIFEIGPVDGQTGRTLDALGTAWSVLLPLCDGDVRNLQGMMPFDRMTSASDRGAGVAKSMLGVWGANHNYYNTEWQQSDSRGCSGAGNKPLFALSPSAGVSGSPAQQATGLHAAMAFFRAHVGRDPERAYDALFDPQHAVPETLRAVTRVQRVYTDGIDPASSLVLEDFTAPSGTSKAGLPLGVRNVTVTHGDVPEHDRVLKAAAVKWTAASADTSLEVPLASAADGAVDVRGRTTLDLRVSRQRGAGNPTTAETVTSFSIQLVRADGSLTAPVRLKDHVDVLAPVGSRYPQWVCDEQACHGPMTVQPGPAHVLLDSVRIPLAAFGKTELAGVRAVRFTFDDTPIAVR